MNCWLLTSSSWAVSVPVLAGGEGCRQVHRPRGVGEGGEASSGAGPGTEAQRSSLVPTSTWGPSCPAVRWDFRTRWAQMSPVQILVPWGPVFAPLAPSRLFVPGHGKVSQPHFCLEFLGS